MNARKEDLLESDNSGELNIDTFSRRHIGPQLDERREMLKYLGFTSLDELIAKTVPSSIALKNPLSLPEALSEPQALAEMRNLASENQMFRSYIGLGYYNTFTPPVILRNILENPGWYTAYTPYQAEIAQGRLEALANFQTVVMDLTGLPIANASLLDEGTAAAEAMTMCARILNDDLRTKFFVAADCHPQTIDVVQNRALPLGMEVVVGDVDAAKLDKTYVGALVQYPGTDGRVRDFTGFANKAHAEGVLVVAATDLLSLALLTPPGEWGADVAIGNSQRFGVPLGYGGPHAAFMSCKEEFKREIPGRLIGLSKDAAGKPAYRLALQTREQHIRREKATSNICTAQVLLAVMASMYAVYHGPAGIRAIATRVNRYASRLADTLKGQGFKLASAEFFDSIRVITSKEDAQKIQAAAVKKKINFRAFPDGNLGISIDETVQEADLQDILDCFAVVGKKVVLEKGADSSIPKGLLRKSTYLTHPVFSRFHSETELLRYIHRLESKDLSLNTSMIPLGSCTMKLNATTEMIPITWSEFAGLHPFAPVEQAQGYAKMFSELGKWLCEITGFSAFSLQPNAGSQGEYSGLLVIRAYHMSRGDAHRNICLIPQSAHGTNPATATMVGMKVVIVKCDESGNVDVADLKARAEEHKKDLAALMVTYPSTHGVFESAIKEICDIIHSCGGQVYMDGANLNAQVGLCRPADFGADVCHSNLHKTFCIPHGGGGPGMGPIGVKAHLAPFLPGHPLVKTGGQEAIGAVSAAPWGSAAILPIPYVYMLLMGGEGLAEATKVAILNANYVAKRLEPYFPVLYRGANGMVAHECILDLRKFKRSIGIEAADVGKRLMDYGFHAPTVSFPVVETLMVEPTESESKEELDRFCEAMILIRKEIEEIEQGKADKTDNLLKNAPHTAESLLTENWSHPYSRERAAYPAAWLREHKFWPAVSRIDSVYGDRNLFCACAPMS